MNLNNRVSSLIELRDRNYKNKWSIYTGVNGDDRVLNDDGSNPYTRIISAREDKLLALDPNVTILTEIVRVTLVTSTEPNPNLTWWISDDEGASKKRCQFLKRESKVSKGFWWVFLVLN